MTDYSAIIAANAERWGKMKILPSRALEVEAVAARLCAPRAKAIYQQIATATDVPWSIIAVIHEREGSQNFALSLAQGDRWDRVSVHVPRGIGPFKSFVEAAIFSLNRCPPFAAKWKDWTIGGALTLLELYNGLGYEGHREPSPYDWGATNIEQAGKYIADGVYSPSTWDTQIGCAAMLFAMMELDKSISFGSGSAQAKAGALAQPVMQPTPPASAETSGP